MVDYRITIILFALKVRLIATDLAKRTFAGRASKHSLRFADRPCAFVSLMVSVSCHFSFYAHYGFVEEVEVVHVADDVCRRQVVRRLYILIISKTFLFIRFSNYPLRTFPSVSAAKTRRFVSWFRIYLGGQVSFSRLRNRGAAQAVCLTGPRSANNRRENIEWRALRRGRKLTRRQ